MAIGPPPDQPDSWIAARPFVEAIANGLDCGVLVADGQRVVLVNNALSAMFGIAPERVASMSTSDFIRLVATLVDPPPSLLREGRVLPEGAHVVCEQFEVTRPSRAVIRWVARRVDAPAPAQIIICTDITAEIDVAAAYERLSVTDQLTGIANRRGAEQIIRREMVRVRRQAAPLSFVLLDCDQFSQVNELVGRSSGDQILRQVARAIAGQLRESDLPARWGGEEFLLVLPDTPLESARACADRIRRAVEALSLHFGARVTVSAGVSQVLPGETVAQTLGRLEAHLKQAQGSGGNRVC